MKVYKNNQEVRFSEIEELSASKASELKQLVQDEMNDSTSGIVFELSSTKFIDSGGLGLLISLHKSMSAKGGKCSVENPSPIVLQVLELTRLHKVFEVRQDIKEEVSKYSSVKELV